MDQRPDPDVLLAQVRADENHQRRGRLKIFFGYAAGVGKTYSMLENAHRAKGKGRDVVLGYVEPHPRPATQALIEGFEAIPVRELEYRSVRLKEFDIDAALARRPELILVDELAHTNAEGSRHSKRWQDVEDLLEAGIDVWSTLNVQHIESLNDIVGQVTGVVVRETVPDKIFEAADEIELVDLPPADLMDRLEKGQVYLPEQAQRAVQSFFHKSNLSALRELSLRQAASRIHTDVESARKLQSDTSPWATTERLLVCVGTSPTTAKVIRCAKRMAVAFDAKWLAVSADVPGVAMNAAAAESVSQHFRLAEQLGAETVTVTGDSVVGAILAYARSRNVTKILIGKTIAPSWKRLLSRNVADKLIESSGGIDVYVIQGEYETRESLRPVFTKRRIHLLSYLKSGGIILICGLMAGFLRTFRLADSEANTVMLFLAGVAFVAFRLGSGPATAACIAAVLIFDFFFVPPFFTFAVSDMQYIVTFAVMLAIGLLISTLASRLKAQVQNSRVRESRTSSLYALGRQLSSLYGELFLISAAAEKVREMLGCEVAIYLRRRTGNVELVLGSSGESARDFLGLAAAQWVIEHCQLAGAGTNTLPNAGGLFVPLQGSQATLGCIALKAGDDVLRLLEPESKRLLEACGNQLALALERDQLAIAGAELRIQSEAEQVRSTLLSSVSHDLKTPLAAIAGASSTLQQSNTLDAETQIQLLETISSETARLNRVLENILQMSKLDAGATSPRMQWHVLEEIVGSALNQTQSELKAHKISVELPRDLPLIYVDDVLLEQILINLLENAAKYTPAGTPVSISGAVDGRSLRISVRDRGSGILVGLEEKIFEKFHRANLTPDSGKGNGLGLAICRAIATILGGSITASNPEGGGADFVLRLPLPKTVPSVPVE